MRYNITYYVGTGIYEFIYILAVSFFYKAIFGIKSNKNHTKRIKGLITYICIVLINYIGQQLTAKQDDTALLLVVVFLIMAAYFFKSFIYLYISYSVKLETIGFLLCYNVVDYSMSLTLSVAFCKLSGLGDEQLLVPFCGILWEIFLIIFLKLKLKTNNSLKFEKYFLSISNMEYIHITGFLFMFYIVEIGVIFSDVVPFVKNAMLVMELMALLLIAFVFVLKEKNKSIENISNELKKQITVITEYYGELKNKDTEIRQFRHDIKNHLYMLEVLIENNQIADAKTYISEIEDNYRDATVKFNTGSYIADAIITAKQKRANEVNASIIVNGAIPSKNILDVDMVILLSNLLDNAVEACSKIKGNKTIIFDSYLEKRKWLFKISNPVVEMPVIINNQIRTTKSDISNHGMGILNIKKIVDKYAGNILFTSDGKQFEASAFLQIEGQDD